MESSDDRGPCRWTCMAQCPVVHSNIPTPTQLYSTQLYPTQKVEEESERMTNTMRAPSSVPRRCGGSSCLFALPRFLVGNDDRLRCDPPYVTVEKGQSFLLRRVFVSAGMPFPSFPSVLPFLFFFLPSCHLFLSLLSFLPSFPVHHLPLFIPLPHFCVDSFAHSRPALHSSNAFFYNLLLAHRHLNHGHPCPRISLHASAALFSLPSLPSFHSFHSFHSFQSITGCCGGTS